MNYYRGPRPFAHFDLYRISTENDLCAAGFYDYLDEGAVVAAEWSENFADLLALEDPIHINIERVDDTAPLTVSFFAVSCMLVEAFSISRTASPYVGIKDAFSALK